MKKTSPALVLVNKLLDEGEEPLRILAMIIIAFRQLWLGVDNWRRTGDSKAACTAAGRRFYQSEFMSLVRKLSAGDIPYIYRRLVETDGALKGGEKLPGLALEKMILELADRK